MNVWKNGLLTALYFALNNKTISVDAELSSDEWEFILATSREQKLLSAIYHVSCGLSSFKKVDKNTLRTYRDAAVLSVTRQIVQTNEFLTLILHAQEQGLDPIVVKGITVRSLYPVPCLRPSVDEDLLISAGETENWHRFLLSEGLFLDDPNSNEVSPMNMAGKDLTSAEMETATELSYHKENSPTYIELHKTLFDPDSNVYGNFNALFPDVFVHTMRMQIEDVSVRTLEPTYHFLYLILHAFKHFVHSGIGIRAACDIGMFAEHYQNEIDWGWIRKSLEKVNAFTFARGMLCIVKKYLMPDALFFDQIKDWRLESLDVEPLLEDILASGVHGASSMTRLHSSNMTLNAVANQKKEQSVKKGTLRHMLFPSVKKLAGRYPYLKKMPLLLPLAWAQRAGHYLTESRKNRAVSDAAESLRLGEARIRLLKQYGIIDKK